MSRHLLQFALVTSVIAAAFFAACGPPTPPGEETLFLVASPLSIANNGATSTLTVTAKDAQGNAGTGTVTLIAAVGSLGGGGGSASVTLGTNGTGTTTYACSFCTPGPVHIDAVWNTPNKIVSSFTNVTVTSPGGGGDGGSDGGSDAGSDAGNAPGTSLAAPRTVLYAGIGDFIDVVAHAGMLPDGGGAPRSGVSIDFSTTGTASVRLGQAVDGGTSGTTYNATTDGSGNAVVRLLDNASSSGQSGTLTARETGTTRTASMNFTVSAVSLVSWVSTRCTTPQGQTVDCTLLGIRNSGFQEQAQVTFRVMDTSATPQPVAGVPVSFTIINGPSGITRNPGTALTGANGQVTTTVTSGQGTGTFVVRASIGAAAADSPTLAVRGAKASNKGFSFDCTTVNLATYVANTPPNPLTDVCTVKLVDRFGNPVGTGTSVNFKTEAGSITNSVPTQPFNTMPNADNTREGYGTVTFDTRGVFPPAETDPLAADGAQWPFARAAEPSLTVGAGVIRNPRDGLVTVVAYLKGEEYYDDNNTNGQWDTGEPFLDQGEAFVDANDDGNWDPGELYVDDSPANGVWDAPNQQWDGNTTISTELRLLYTGRPVGDSSHTYLVPPSFGTCAGGDGIAKGAPRTYFDAWFGDQNLNRSIAGTSFRTLLLPSLKGSAGWFSGIYLDGYGFGIDRQRLDATTLQACNPATSTRCIWKTLFYQWGRGYAGQAYVDAAPLTDTNPCADVTLSVGSTVLGVELLVSAPGALK
jgi:hypothetical protein